MFIELAGSLRCIHPHESTWLVAAAEQMHDRDIVRGTLGCPMCHAEFRIDNGVALFGAEPMVAGAEQPAADDYEVLRAAALLNFQGNMGFVLLCGEWSALAVALAEPTAPHVLAVNSQFVRATVPGVSALVTATVLPLAERSARGAALDAAAVELFGTDAVARIVADTGRIVAPANAPLPGAARLLASDDRHWVAEVSHPPIASITLGRRRPQE